MQSKNIGYIEKLDHIRFLAAFAVIEFHSDIWMRSIGAPREPLPLPLFHQGYVGVALFMVISGFILTAITYDKQIETWRFYLNRILRIYPLLIFVVTLGYFVTPDPREASTGVDYLLALLPISNLYRLHYGAYGGVLFSVAIELQFYLLFPALAYFLRRYGIRHYVEVIMALIALRGVVFALQGTVHHLAYFSIFGALDIFLIGALAWIVYIKTPMRRYSGWTVLAVFVGINIVIWAAHAHRSFFHFDFDGVTSDGTSRSALWIVWPTLEGLMFAALVLVYLRSGFSMPFAGVFAYLGKISYSLYVWHTIIFLGLVRSHLNFLPAFEMGLFVVLPLAVLISHFSYRLIERPFLEMRVRYVAPASETQVPPSKVIA